MKVYNSELKKVAKLDEIADGGMYLGVGKEGLVKDKGSISFVVNTYF